MRVAAWLVRWTAAPGRSSIRTARRSPWTIPPVTITRYVTAIAGHAGSTDSTRGTTKGAVAKPRTRRVLPPTGAKARSMRPHVPTPSGPSGTASAAAAASSAGVQTTDRTSPQASAPVGLGLAAITGTRANQPQDCINPVAGPTVRKEEGPLAADQA